MVQNNVWLRQAGTLSIQRKKAKKEKKKNWAKNKISKQNFKKNKQKMEEEKITTKNTKNGTMFVLSLASNTIVL